MLSHITCGNTFPLDGNAPAVDKIGVSDTIQPAQFTHAEVAELADALGSGLSDRKVVRVQVPPSAPKNPWKHGFLFSIKTLAKVERCE